MAADLTATEAADLQAFLSDNYNTPSVNWLRGILEQFEALRTLLEQGISSAQSDSDGDVSERTRLPSAARAAVIPVIKLIPVTCLPVMDESFLSYGIGTVSSNTFEDIFWQKVDEVNNRTLGSPRIEVYAADNGTFDFRFGSYTFQFVYFQREKLVRTCPEILETDSAILVEGAANDTFYKELIRIQALRSLLNSIMDSLGCKVTSTFCYFLRAYAIECGAFYNFRIPPRDNLFFDTHNILKVLNQAIASLMTEGVALTSHSVIAQCFKIIDGNPATHFSRFHRVRDLQPDRTFSRSALMRVRDLTMDLKMDFPYPYVIIVYLINILLCHPGFVRVNIEYNGSSSILRGMFFHVVESQLEKLVRSILAIVKQPASTEKPPCVLWPSRLFEKTIDSSAVGDWVYVLGLRPPVRGDPIFEAKLHGILKDWVGAVASHEECDESTCFVNANVVDSSEMRYTLVNCTKITRRKAIHGPKRNAIPANALESRENSRRKKNHKEARSNNESTRGLKEASHVLKALRHDPKYDIDDFKVGYLDRFKSAIQEKPAADWQTDTQHDEFIAEHRIEYFKKCPQNGDSEIWWEKKTKTDKFFRTGTSTEP